VFNVWYRDTCGFNYLTFSNYYISMLTCQFCIWYICICASQTKLKLHSKDNRKNKVLFIVSNSLVTMKFVMKLETTLLCILFCANWEPHACNFVWIGCHLRATVETNPLTWVGPHLVSKRSLKNLTPLHSQSFLFVSLIKKIIMNYIIF